MTTLPTWAVYAISIGTPTLTFLGVLVAQLFTRRGDVELETRSKREETMRTMRWAAELSASADDRTVSLGVAELAALLESDLLDESDKVFVEAALDAVYEPIETEIEQLGDDVEVVQYLTDEVEALVDATEGGVSLERDDGDGGDLRG
ncbi:hypothetical protein [Hyphomicrobium sulfonivorans]|uniref:hypothetical protein n=1 Tax=Hyphomicrobium sulfonivorans TaxID=121290 RepID=UPI001570BD24|nr:hypothetical protein [Hyphomicrobium sulfonivorans]